MTQETIPSVEVKPDAKVVRAVRSEQARRKAVAKPAPKARAASEKAEPTEIREFLDGLGLTNRQAAEALGKSVALVATVRND